MLLNRFIDIGNDGVHLSTSVRTELDLDEIESWWADPFGGSRVRTKLGEDIHVLETTSEITSLVELLGGEISER